MKRIDERFEAIGISVDDRFNKVDARFEKVDAHFEKLETKIEELAAGLVEVKIAIARLEGPQRRFQLLDT